MVELRWSLLAAEDLENICLYIEKDSERYARIAQEIVGMADLIPIFPYSGRMVAKYNSEFIREKMIKSYRVIYRIHGEYIEVVRILRQSRQLTDNLEE
ncbi:type II toxin-antitoxin system RelE/ParE family toxin [Salicibibacter halophilus]|uniref:Type II toxin-antitoxin system RelE/ParE family toxin n=1 Tax=Salicibibacter halophilus TaxID=2502791 RepID=A0A514LFM5_9BACI|nr:type II toxin-antitoxin system RelE/ParE family toxin [Salicibibacter halophilus]QDI90676.1 type II toxin-antitoxin system RelE/ParE family toxin [Salicibibacter halophilus]